MRITSSVWAAEMMQHALMRRQRHCYEQNEQNNAHLCLLIALNDAIVVIKSLQVESTVTLDGNTLRITCSTGTKQPCNAAENAGGLRLLDVRRPPERWL
jgi:hypothetical protein